MSVYCNYPDKTQNLLSIDTTEDKMFLVPLTKVVSFSSKKLRQKWCKQLLYKLHIIHSEFANAHCNVCLDNLKVDGNNDLVLTNVSENSANDAKLVTDAEFKAPELLNCDETSKAGDVWAAGMCVYYVINLSFPWQVADEKDASFCLWKREGKFSSTVESSFVKVIAQMLCVDPVVRASTKEALKRLWDDKTDAEVLSKFYLTLQFGKDYRISLELPDVLLIYCYFKNMYLFFLRTGTAIWYLR